LNRGVIRQRILRDNLKIAQSGAVIQLDEREIFGIAAGPHPALHLNRSMRSCFAMPARSELEKGSLSIHFAANADVQHSTRVRQLRHGKQKVAVLRKIDRPPLKSLVSFCAIPSSQ